MTKFNDIKVGKAYEMVNKQFNNAKNRVVCVSEDVLGLRRPIKYFCFADRITKIPTKKELIQALKDGATNHSNNKKKLQKACRMLEIRRSTFALWDVSLNTTELSEI